jgi:protein-disulfide isomerase
MSALKVPVGPEDHIQGSPGALATLLEYGDYECSFCGRAYPVIKLLQKHFGKRLRFVFRNFPLTQMHPNAEPAAETAEFAGSLGKFWEMHDQLYENQNRLGGPLYLALANTLRLPADSLAEALETHEFLPKIRADFTGGVRSGVNGTPTLFINDKRFEGSHDYDTLAAALEDAMRYAAKSARA